MTGDDRIDELLADRALWGLSEDDEAILGRALETAGVGDDRSLDITAAAITAAFVEDLGTEDRATGSGDTDVPDALLRRLEADALSSCVSVHGLRLRALSTAAETGGEAAPGGQVSGPPAPSPPSGSAVLPWLVALAASLLAAVLIWDRLRPEPSYAEQRIALIERGVDLRLDWAPGPDKALRGDPSGDVVWNGNEQAGFMWLRGLPVNDRQQRQYQLWIVDAGRPGSDPVDGGIFDVPPGRDEVVVPIRAPIQVRRAGGFVVTVEDPGGVVVSGQEHVVLMALP